MLNNVTDKKTYLVYQIGSNCMSPYCGIHHLCIAQGNTKKEVIENYVDNVEALYGYRLNPTYNEETDTYCDYFVIYMKEIETSVCGIIYDLDVKLICERRDS